MAKIVLTAGGTGGHVFPAEALAAVLLERGHDLTLVTDARGAEYGGVLGRLRTVRVRAGQVAGRGRLGQLRGLLDILRGAWEARRILASLNPAAVVGFGGYASIPAMAAASMLRLPTILHEQNGVLGRANRLLAKKVSAVATSFEDVRLLPPASITSGWECPCAKPSSMCATRPTPLWTRIIRCACLFLAAVKGHECCRT